jgi:hypothetical protein
MAEDAKAAVLALLEKNSAKGKKKLYPKDIAKSLEGVVSWGEAKKAIQDLLDAGQLAYWSSGSTTYVMLKKDFDEIKEGE